MLPKEHEDHKGHDLKSPIDDEILKKSSLLFKPLDNNKTYAVSYIKLFDLVWGVKFKTQFVKFVLVDSSLYVCCMSIRKHYDD